jgi:site-specific DNA recombinase
VRCSLYGRRTHGSWNHEAAHFRCRFASQYGLANAVDHPKTVYVRESKIMPELDHWLTQLFDPEHIDDTVAAMVDAGSRDEASEARAESARG